MIAEPLALVSPGRNGKKFLQMVEHGSGLLLERENGEYSFAHLTFQEFLAAVHLQEQNSGAELAEQVSDSWWHETIRLYSARADATPILQACLAEDKPSVAALTLAVECIDEAREVQPELRTRLNTILEQGVEDNDPERRRLVAETMLALRLRRMRRVSDDKYVDDSLMTHAEYQLFLDEERAKDNYYQPDHWLALQFPAGQGKTALAGARSSDAKAFCNWLTVRDTEGWQYRIPRTDEFTEPIAEGRVGYWVISETDEVTLLVGVDSDDSARARALALDLDLAIARARALALARALARALDLARDPDRDLDRARDLLRASSRHPNQLLNQVDDLEIAWPDIVDFLRWYIRTLALLMATELHDLLPDKTWSLFGNNSVEQERQKIQQKIDELLNLYINFVILEERVRGNLPALEGIRIVRERKGVVKPEQPD